MSYKSSREEHPGATILTQGDPHIPRIIRPAFLERLFAAEPTRERIDVLLRGRDCVRRYLLLASLEQKLVGGATTEETVDGINVIEASKKWFVARDPATGETLFRIYNTHRHCLPEQRLRRRGYSADEVKILLGGRIRRASPKAALAGEDLDRALEEGYAQRRAGPGSGAS